MNTNHRKGHRNTMHTVNKRNRFIQRETVARFIDKFSLGKHSTDSLAWRPALYSRRGGTMGPTCCVLRGNPKRKSRHQNLTTSSSISGNTRVCWRPAPLYDAHVHKWTEELTKSSAKPDQRIATFPAT